METHLSKLNGDEARLEIIVIIVVLVYYWDILRYDSCSIQTCNKWTNIVPNQKKNITINIYEINGYINLPHYWFQHLNHFVCSFMPHCRTNINLVVDSFFDSGLFSLGNNGTFKQERKWQIVNVLVVDDISCTEMDFLNMGQCQLNKP